MRQQGADRGLGRHRAGQVLVQRRWVRASRPSSRRCSTRAVTNVLVIAPRRVTGGRQRRPRTMHHRRAGSDFLSRRHGRDHRSLAATAETRRHRTSVTGHHEPVRGPRTTRHRADQGRPARHHRPGHGPAAPGSAWSRRGAHRPDRPDRAFGRQRLRRPGRVRGGKQPDHDQPGTGPDSNPYGLLPYRDGAVVTDAGGNDLMRLDRQVASPRRRWPSASHTAMWATDSRIPGNDPAAAVARPMARVVRVPRSAGRAVVTRGSRRPSRALLTAACGYPDPTGRTRRPTRPPAGCVARHTGTASRSTGWRAWTPGPQR